jgi:hypothetical protein
MELLLKSASVVRRCDWPGYALLRDDGPHFLEHGAVTARFSSLHAIDGAVEDGAALVDAAMLRGEVRAALSVTERALDRDSIGVERVDLEERGEAPNRS